MAYTAAVAIDTASTTSDKTDETDDLEESESFFFGYSKILLSQHSPNLIIFTPAVGNKIYHGY